jgi:DNA-binding SARP family transcriptional activator
VGIGGYGPQPLPACPRDRVTIPMAARHDGADRAHGASALAAAAELRRLVLAQQFAAAERMLASLHDIGSATTIDTLRQLCVSGAEQLRIASELDSAARAQRLLAQEVQHGIEALVASWERHIKAAPEPAAAVPASVARNGPAQHRAAQDGAGRRRRWRIFGSGYAASGDRPGSAWPAAAPLIDMESLSSVQQIAVPEAEVAASVLGPLDLTVAGHRVLRWNSLKARTVFEYLVIQIGRPVRREALMELMWPDHTLGSARNNLNAALYSLRNTLGQHGRKVQYILHKDGCYLPNPELMWWVDRNEFLAALQHAELARRGGQPDQAMNCYQQAVRLYRGPLFEDDRDGDWYLPEQHRLKELYLHALQNLAEIHLDIRDLAAAVQLGQLALSADKCCESAHRLLMRCYALQHQQQLVSRQYHLCSAALHDELGVSPGADTVQLFHSLTSPA